MFRQATLLAIVGYCPRRVTRAPELTSDIRHETNRSFNGSADRTRRDIRGALATADAKGTDVEAHDPSH